ncbi:AMP-dependent synthetase/ligase [Saccharicrinis sp. FJH54]|uniref:AMP-dependent synthetase/ligase n=1 Tax=Saccharicrinis sp. FJH54 TaxID=3344665 RepID=UPI0035D46FDC
MKTIIELFETSVKKYASNPFLHENMGKGYVSQSYREIHNEVYVLAGGLIASGFKRGDRASLLSEGRNYWLISELAVLYAGGVNVPLSVKLDAENELFFRIKHSGSKFILTSRHQISKLREIKDKLSDLELIIVFDSIPLEEKEVYIGDVITKGKSYLKNHEKEFVAIRDSIKPQDVANISYTSGTTADPKGIMLSQLNYAANVEQASTLMSIPETHRTLAILPWDHAFAHTACLYAFMYFGASIASVQTGKTQLETLKNVSKNINEIKPHIMMSVPALAKNFRKNIESGIKAKGKVVTSLFQTGLKTAYAYNGLGFDKGRGARMLLKPLVNLFDKIVFSKVREGFGGNLEFFIGGGALLDIELQRFFYALGIPMLQGYGLSEASPIISANSMFRHKLGSSGYLVKNMELRIVDDEGRELPNHKKGEILVKGDNVMLGYWNNPTATAETLKNGWLHTGDLGYMDNDGFLYVFGRFKSLLISSDGEKYSPEGIEEAITDHSQFIDQAMLHNNQDPYTVMFLVPNKQMVLAYLKDRSLDPKNIEGRKEALKLLQSEVDKFKPGGSMQNMFPSRWLPTSIGVLSESFNEENKLMNSTMKIVRAKINEHFGNELKYLYTPEAKNIINSVNLDHMEKFLG